MKFLFEIFFSEMGNNRNIWMCNYKIDPMNCCILVPWLRYMW